MIGRRAILAILICMIMTMVPAAAMADGDESSGGVKDGSISSIDMWWPASGHFNYTEGMAVGRNLNFEMDETTGTVKNYTVAVSTLDVVYPILVYEESYYMDENGEMIIREEFPEFNWTFENVTIFDSIEINGFTPVGHPGTFVDLFVFQGENALMIFHDRDWNQGYYASGDMNNTITFEVAEGLEIWEFPYDWYDDWYYEEDKWDDDERDEGDRDEDERDEDDPDDEHDEDDWDDYPREPIWDRFWTEVWIESENTTTTIVINGGDATIENSTITITLDANCYLEISTWVQIPFFPLIDDLWYDAPEFDEEMETLERAKEDGDIAGEGWYYGGEQDKGVDNSNYYSYEDPTFDMQFNYIGDEGIEIQVDSEIPEGRIVMVNLDDTALKAYSMDDLRVKLDGTPIRQTATLEELTEQVGGTKAMFYALFSESGTTVFVYVPHFSTHTITIESVLGGLGTAANILVPTVLAAVFIAVAALVILLRGKKGQSEY